MIPVLLMRTALADEAPVPEPVSPPAPGSSVAGSAYAPHTPAEPGSVARPAADAPVVANTANTGVGGCGCSSVGGISVLPMLLGAALLAGLWRGRGHS